MASGAILIGGQSKRMGQDKATLVWRQKTLLEHVHGVVAPLVSEVMLVVREEREDWAREIAPPQCRVVCDTVSARGPLAGIHAALGAASYDDVLVTACDMPRLRAELLTALLDDAHGDVAIPQVEGHFEPLPAVYRKSCLPAIETALQEGPRPVPSFFPEVRLSIWDERRLREQDEKLLSLENFNKPADID